MAHIVLAPECAGKAQMADRFPDAVVSVAPEGYEWEMSLNPAGALTRGERDPFWPSNYVGVLVEAWRSGTWQYVLGDARMEVARELEQCGVPYLWVDAPGCAMEDGLSPAVRYELAAGQGLKELLPVVASAVSMSLSRLTYERGDAPETDALLDLFGAEPDQGLVVALSVVMGSLPGTCDVQAVGLANVGQWRERVDGMRQAREALESLLGASGDAEMDGAAEGDDADTEQDALDEALDELSELPGGVDVSALIESLIRTFAVQGAADLSLSMRRWSDVEEPLRTQATERFFRDYLALGEEQDALAQSLDQMVQPVGELASATVGLVVSWNEDPGLDSLLAHFSVPKDGEAHVLVETERFGDAWVLNPATVRVFTEQGEQPWAAWDVADRMGAEDALEATLRRVVPRLEQQPLHSSYEGASLQGGKPADE